jgi:hypothetical protein
VAQYLYVTLRSLEEASEDFVASLTASAEGQDAARESLPWTLRRIGSALSELGRALQGTELQLSIHFPDVARQIEEAQMSRAVVVSKAEEALRDYAESEQDQSAFREIVQQAQGALAEIENATEALRQVLAAEFTFKESF